MHWQYNPYVLPLVIAAAVSAVLALFAWRRRPTPGAMPFALLMLAVAEWSLGYALELGSADLPTQVFWAKVEYLGIVSVSVMWLAFVLQYTGRDKWLTRRNAALVVIVPLVTLLLVWTNEAHGLIWSSIGQDTSGSFLVLDSIHGAWFWVHSVYSYLLLLLGTVLLIQAFIRSPRLYRGQAAALLIGALMPWVGNVLYIFKLSPFSYLDLTPFAFTLTGLAATWGLFRFRLLDIVPVARDAVIESMSDAVIVVDAQNRIVDLNPAAEGIIGRPASETIGQSVAQVFSAWPDLVERYHDLTEAHEEFIVGEGEGQRCFDLRISPLHDRRGRLTGRLAVLRDITERKRTEEALHKSEARSRALLNAMPDLIFQISKEGIFLSYKAAREGDLAVPPSEFLGRKVNEVMPPEFAQRVMDYVERTLQTGDMQVFEYQLPVLSGEIRDFEGRIVVSAEDEVLAIVRDITERKRAEEEIRQRTAQLEALRQVGLEITAELDLDILLHSIASRAMALVGGTAGGLYLYRPDRNVLEWSVPVGPNLTPIGTVLRRGEGLAGKVWEAGQPLMVDDYQRWEGRAAAWEGYPVRAAVSAPVRWGEEFLGVLNVHTNIPQAFSLTDAELLSLFATQAAIAIRNACLYQEARSRAQRLEVVNRIAKAVGAILDPDGLMETVYQEVAAVFQPDAFFIALYDEGSSELDYRLRVDEGIREPRERRPLGTGLTSLVMTEKKPILIRDFEKEREHLPEVRLWGTMKAPPSWLGVPMLIGDRVVGVISVQAYRPHAYGEEEQLLLSTIAEQVAVAVENARLYEETRRRLEYMQALRSVDMAIAASVDLHPTLNVLLDQTINQLQVDAATVLLFNPHLQTLEYAAGRGFRTDALRHTSLRLGQGYAGQAALERRIVNVPNLTEAEDGLRRAPLLAGEGFVAYYAVPLLAKGQIKGVLEIFHRAPLDPDEEWLNFLEALVTQAAIAIDNATLFADLQRANVELTLAYDSTLAGWARALELRDKETKGHTDRVTEMALRLARAMGMRDEELVHLRRGALLHDIGKMGISDTILQKPEPLSEEEWEIMRQHPVYAYEMLSPIAYLRRALDIPYCHHERWDGSGYPQGLKGEEIPLAARIFAVVDVWDALLSERPYREAWPEEKAMEYIRQQAGKHFDPRVVGVFLEWVCKARERADKGTRGGDPLQGMG